MLGLLLCDKDIASHQKKIHGKSRVTRLTVQSSAKLYQQKLIEINGFRLD